MARAVSGLDKKLTTASLIRVRLISPLICYLPLTVRHSRVFDIVEILTRGYQLAYSLLTLAFGLPFGIASGLVCMPRDRSLNFDFAAWAKEDS